jgi:hypothetical protein
MEFNIYQRGNLTHAVLPHHARSVCKHYRVTQMDLAPEPTGLRSCTDCMSIMSRLRGGNKMSSLLDVPKVTIQ